MSFWRVHIVSLKSFTRPFSVAVDNANPAFVFPIRVGSREFAVKSRFGNLEVLTRYHEHGDIIFEPTSIHFSCPSPQQRY